MPNLILTNTCNISCPFCFASESKPQLVDKQAMTKTEFWMHADRFDPNAIRFCGGEPTVHPEFIDLVRTALQRPACTVHLLTNGIWKDSVLAYFRELAQGEPDKFGRVSYMFNVLRPSFYSRYQERRLGEVLDVIDPEKAELACTIYHHDFDFEYVIDLALRHGIKRLRHSVAAPTVSDPRTWHFDPESDFPRLATLVFELVTRAQRAGLEVTGDCGYIPPCFFTPEQRSEMRRPQPGGNPVRYVCTGGSAGAGDVDRSGKCWRCYGLYGLYQARVDECSSDPELRRFHERRMRVLDQLMLFEDCETCEFRADGSCGGACYTYRVIDAVAAGMATSALVPTDTDEALLRAVPALVSRKGEGVTQAEGVVDGPVGDTPDRLSRDGTLFLSYCDGVRTVAEIAESLTCAHQWTRDRSLLLARQLFESDHLTFLVTLRSTRRVMPVWAENAAAGGDDRAARRRVRLACIQGDAPSCSSPGGVETEAGEEVASGPALRAPSIGKRAAQ